MNRIKIAIIVLVVAGAVLLAGSSYRQIQIKKKADREAILLPDISFTDLENRPFSRSDIAWRTKGVVINHFNPNCEHCQYMAKALVQEAHLFRDYQVLMVSASDRADLLRFRDQYKLQQVPGLVVLRDPEAAFFRFFGTGLVPAFFIYDREGNLKKKILGETKIQNLLPETDSK